MEKNGKYILLEGAHKSCSFKLVHVLHIYLNEKYCYHTIHILFITFVKYVTFISVYYSMLIMFNLFEITHELYVIIL